MVFVREDVLCKLLSLENKPMEGFYVEINLRKAKWLLCCSYNLSRSNIDFHREHLNQNLALYSYCYENFIIGDFNVEANNSAISVFSDTYNLKNIIIIKEPTCYKIPINLLVSTLCWQTNREVSNILVWSKQACLIFTGWQSWEWKQSLRNISQEK